MNKATVGNINKLDTILKEEYGYESVKADLNNNIVNLEVKKGSKKINMFFNIQEVNNNNNVLNWSYYTNPNDKNSRVIERVSKNDNIVNDLNNIFEKNMFSKEYINEINSNVINENYNTNSKIDFLILEKKGINYIKIDKLAESINKKFNCDIERVRLEKRYTKEDYINPEYNYLLTLKLKEGVVLNGELLNLNESLNKLEINKVVDNSWFSNNERPLIKIMFKDNYKIELV